MEFLSNYFKFKEKETNFKSETIGGITTFLTMAYALFLIPSVLGEAGMPQGSVFVATGLAAALGTLIMGIFANFPMGLAPGVGLNAFFAYSVCLGMGIKWEIALSGVLASGIIFLIISATGLREMIIKAIPTNLKFAVSAGIGLFIAFIGLKNAGIVVANSATFVGLGDLTDPTVLLSIFGVIAISIFMVRGSKIAIFLGMGLTAIVGMITGLIDIPTSVISMPPSMAPTFGAAIKNLGNIFNPEMILVIFTFLFMDLFDTVGFLVGVAAKGELIDENGKIPKAKQAMLADAIGTTIGAMLGTSTVTCFMESTAGISEGGKTGLTAFTVGVLFVLSLFLAPLFIAIPSQATGAVLIIVGVMMASCFKEIDFEDYTNAIPAFLTFILMPLTNSVADGIIFGIVSYTLLKLVTNKKEDINISLIVLSLIFICRFVFLK